MYVFIYKYDSYIIIVNFMEKSKSNIKSFFNLIRALSAHTNHILI